MDLSGHKLQLVGISLFACLLVLSGLSGIVFGLSSQATFTGNAIVRMVGKTADGHVVAQQFGAAFTVSASGGGPGIGTMTLNIPGMSIPGTVSTGRITVTSNRASGGGTLTNAMMGSQFAFTVTSAGGQFECLMAGFSGGFAFGGLTQVLQMDVHGTIAPGALVTG